MNARPPPHSTIGRWTVLRYAQPAKRRANDRGVRARVYVRCVCGREKLLWLEDLLGGRSAGCRSIKCQIRNDTASSLCRMIDELTRGDPKARAIGNRLKTLVSGWHLEQREKEARALEQRLADELEGRGLYDDGGSDGQAG